MLYGLLLVSETQGVGKTTLGERILAPLVGWHNVSVPDATHRDRQRVQFVDRKRQACFDSRDLRRPEFESISKAQDAHDRQGRDA